MLCGKTRGYVLTFRCVNCGRYEAFSWYPSEGNVREDQIRARIYQANCEGCGWRGDACGLSAVRIYRTPETLPQIRQLQATRAYQLLRLVLPLLMRSSLHD